MHLYSSKLSPWGQRVWMQIRLKDLPIERLPAPGGSLKSPEYLAINPLGKVPALVDGPLVLPESEVICEYLEDKFPTPSLRGAPGEDAARVRLLSRLCDLYVLPPLATLLLHKADLPVEDGAAHLAKAKEALDQLAHFLGPGPFANREALTLADCALVPAVFLAVHVLPVFEDAPPLANRAKLALWWQAIQGEAVAAEILAELTAGYRGFRERIGWPRGALRTQVE